MGCGKRAARSRKRSARGPTRFSLPTRRREVPAEGRRRERHHFRRWRADRTGPKRPPRAHAHRARDGAWHAYYHSGDGAGTGHSEPCQAGSPLPADSTGQCRPYSAGWTGCDGRGPVVGANRDERHRRCPRRHLRAEGRAGRGNQRRRRSQGNRSGSAVGGRLTPPAGCQPAPPAIIGGRRADFQSAAGCQPAALLARVKGTGGWTHVGDRRISHLRAFSREATNY